MSLDLRQPASNLDELLKSAGAQTEPTPEEMQVTKQKQVEQIQGVVERDNQARAKATEQNKTNVLENTQATVQTIAGIGVGLGDIVTNIYNGAVGLADTFAQFTAEDPEKFEKSKKAVNPLAVDNGMPVDLGKGGDITRAVTNFAGPMVATMGTGGTFLAATGVNAAYNFLAIDPEQERLSDHLKGTVVEDIPIASDLVDYLQTKPGDTEMQSRMKNLAEGVALDSTIGLMAWGASRAYSGIKWLRNKNVLDEATSKVNAFESAASKADDVSVTTQEQDALNASDEAISGPQPEAPTPEQVAADASQANEADYSKAVQENPTLYNGTNEEGLGANGIDSDDFIEWASNEVRSNPEAFKRGPVSDVAVDAGASTFTQEEVVEVLKWRPGVGRTIPGTEAVRIIGLIEERAAVRARASLAALDLSNINEDAVLAYTREFENLEQLTAQADAIGSEMGRAFRQFQRRGDDALDVVQDVLPAGQRDVTGTVQPRKDDLRPAKILAGISGLSEEDALKQIGKLGRERMKREIYKKYGGKEAMKDKVVKIKMLAEQKMVEKFPNDSFKKMFSDIEAHKGIYTETSALDKVALNGMLSGPPTWGKAFLGNLVTSSMSVADNYLSATILGGSKTLAEANAHAAASFAGLYEGLRPAYAAFKNKGANVATKFDIPESFVAKNVEDIAENKAFGWGSPKEAAVDILTVGEAPRRIMVAIDTHAQHVTSTGVVHAEAVRAGMQANLQGKELENFVEFFVANPTPAVLERAKGLAETNTFAKNLSGGYASAQDTISKAIGPIPVVRMMLPFTKTGFNVMEQSIQRSPLAWVLDSQVRMDIAAGGRLKEDALAKIATGTTATLGFMGLSYMGMLKGESYDLKSYRADRATEGSTPRGAAIKMPGTDKWIEIPRGLAPLTTMINTSHLMMKASSYLGDDEYETAVNVFRAAAATQLEAAGLTEGVSAILNLMDPNAKVDLQKEVTDLALSYVPMSGAMRTARNFVDPVKRDAQVDKSEGALDRFYKTFQNRMKNIIPGMSDDLPAQQNVWGQDIEIPNGFPVDAVSPISVANTGDLELKKTFEGMDHYYTMNKDVVPGLARVAVEMPERNMSNKLAPDIPYKFSPQEYATFVKLNAGIDPLTGDRLNGNATLQETVKEVMAKYGAIGKDPADFPKSEYRALTAELNRTFMNYRERARQMILMPEYGEVQDKMAGQAQEFMENGLEVAGGGQ